jgi:hypothetical protein
MWLVPIALGMARGVGRGSRWRRWVVPVAAGIMVASLLTSVAVVLMAARHNERNAQRAPNISAASSEADVFLRIDGDIWRGERILVVWVEPASARHDSVHPPGMAALPPPGHAVVSPALHRLASQASSLESRYPHRDILGWEGVGSGGELLAYVRPPAGRTLGDHEEAVRREDGRFLGQGPLVRVSGFNGGSAGLQLADPLPVAQIALALVGLVCVPATLLLSVSLAIQSRARDARGQLLYALGASRRRLWSLVALEALILALPGLVTGTILWLLVVPSLTLVPFLGARIPLGDLAVPVAVVVVVLLVAVSLCAISAVAVSRLASRRALPRPVGHRESLSLLAGLPLAAALVCFALVPLVRGNVVADLKLAGAVLGIVGTPLIMPAICRLVGAFLAESRSVTVGLVGRAMQWDPRRAVRPFMGLGALLVLTLAGSGYVAVASHVEEPPAAAGDLGVTSVEWLDQRPGDLQALATSLPAFTVVPYALGQSSRRHDEHQHDHVSGGSGVMLRLGGSCSQLVSLLGGSACDRQDDLTDDAGLRLSQAASGALGYQVESVRLVPSDSLNRLGQVLVMSTRPARSHDEATRTGATAVLPAPMVHGPSNQAPVRSPLVAWSVAGVALGAALLFLACVVALLDRSSASLRARTDLLQLGLSGARLRLIESLTFAVPYLVVTVVGLVAGFTACFTMVGGVVDMPWEAVVVIPLVASVVGVLGAVVVAALVEAGSDDLVARSALEMPS